MIKVARPGMEKFAWSKSMTHVDNNGHPLASLYLLTMYRTAPHSCGAQQFLPDRPEPRAGLGLCPGAESTDCAL